MSACDGEDRHNNNHDQKFRLEYIYSFLSRNDPRVMDSGLNPVSVWQNSLTHLTAPYHSEEFVKMHMTDRYVHHIIKLLPPTSCYCCSMPGSEIVIYKVKATPAKNCNKINHTGRYRRTVPPVPITPRPHPGRVSTKDQVEPH